MEKEDILRINALAKKQQAEGLNELEKAEQAALRRQYIDEYRASLKATLDSVLVEQEDGTYAPLPKKAETFEPSAKLTERQDEQVE